MDPKQIVDSYTQDVEGLAARAVEAREQIRQLAGTASSQDGAVTVTVNGGGALRSLSFGPAADQVPRSRLADVVMATARRPPASYAPGTGIGTIGLTVVFMVFMPVSAIVLVIAAVHASAADRPPMVAGVVASVVIGVWAHVRFWRRHGVTR